MAGVLYIAPLDRGGGWRILTVKVAELKNLTIKNIMENLNKLNKQENRQENKEMSALALRARNEPRWNLEEVAEDPSTPPEILDLLARREDDTFCGSDLHSEIIENPNTSSETLDYIAERKWGSQWSLLRHPNISPEAIHGLARRTKDTLTTSRWFSPRERGEMNDRQRKDEFNFRKSIATDPRTLPQTLTLLATIEDRIDYGADMRECLLKNPNTPPEARAICEKENKEQARRDADSARSRRERNNKGSSWTPGMLEDHLDRGPRW